MRSFPESASQFLTEKHCEFEDKIMRISSTDVIEGSHVLYTIGKIKAASSWHAANGAPPQDNWRDLVVSELIRKAEDIDADAIISFDYETDSIVPIEGTGLQLKRILATGVAVKLSCAARLNGIAQKAGSKQGTELRETRAVSA